MDFLKNFFTSEDKILETTFCLVFTTINDYSENDLVLKLADDFLASHYASLTTKNNNFVWFTTLQNLNQFQKNLVFSNQHEKFYLLMKFGKI